MYDHTMHIYIPSLQDICLCISKYIAEQRSPQYLLTALGAPSSIKEIPSAKLTRIYYMDGNLTPENRGSGCCFAKTIHHPSQVNVEDVLK